MDYELLKVLEELRAYMSKVYGKVKVGINSGYRCNHHNMQVGGSIPSQHSFGRAADIVMYYKFKGKWISIPESIIYNYLEAKYPDKYGLGAYTGRTHIDTASGGRRRWIG